MSLEPGEGEPVSPGENHIPDPHDFLGRAKAHGFKDQYDHEVRSEYRIAEGMAQSIISGFETENETEKFPNPSDQSYSLISLDINPAYGTNLKPSYRLTPPSDSNLPAINVWSEGVRIAEDELRSFDMDSYPPAKGGKDAFLRQILDTFDYIHAKGIRSDDVKITLGLSGDEQGGEEALAAFRNKFPKSDSLISTEVREAAITERARVIREYEDRMAELRAEAERQHAEQERLRKDEEGHDFEDGLRKYVARLDRERVDSHEGAMAASLRESARRLMWTGEGEEIRKGEVFADDKLPLIERLTGGYHITDRNRMNEYPRQTLKSVERALTQDFIRIRRDHSGKKVKEVIEIPPERKSGRFEREGEMDSPNKPESGARRGHSITREASGALMIRPADGTTFTKLKVTLAPDEVLTADLLDRDGYPVLDDDGIQKTITAKPILRARLTERVEGKDKPEKTSLYRTREGLFVKCPGTKTIKCYPDDLSTNANVTRKPVIYLYPKKQMQIRVKLNYKGTLTNTYPQIDGNRWNVTATPNGTLKVNGKQYKYLFWDGINGEVDWDWSEGFCINRSNVDKFLEKKIEQLGLNFAEAQDFITYWAPMIKQNEWSLVSFQTEKYEELAKLMIEPQPDTLIRVFMIFKKCEEQVAIQEQKIQRMKRKGFTAVEWGGSNLDELQLNEKEINPHFVPKGSHFQIV